MKKAVDSLVARVSIEEKPNSRCVVTAEPVLAKTTVSKKVVHSQPSYCMKSVERKKLKKPLCFFEGGKNGLFRFPAFDFEGTMVELNNNRVLLLE